MQALQVPGYSYNCPSCGLCGSQDPLETDLKSRNVMIMDNDQYIEDLGDENVYYDHEPRRMKIYVCKDCSMKFEAGDKPTVYKNWECGGCGSVYYGEDGRDTAQDCCL